MPTMLNHILKLILEICWPVMLFFTIKFLISFIKRENKAAIICLALIGIIMLYGNFTAPVRGGYDNNHDFQIMGNSISETKTLFLYKEVSPVFLKSSIDIASNYSLAALLTFNRALPLLSLFLFYAGLRSIGSGIISSLLASVFLFLNFHLFLNASSFSTTSANFFTIISSFTAFSACFAKQKISDEDIIWIFSATIITSMARIETVPALFIMGIGLLYEKRKVKDPILNSFSGKFLSILGIICLMPCLYFQLFKLSYSTIGLASTYTPLKIISLFHMQMIEENLAILFSPVPAEAFPKNIKIGIGIFIFIAIIICIFSYVKNKKNSDRIPALAYLLTAIYFSLLYSWQDLYPLHFMRHRLFFMIPFAALIPFLLRYINDIIFKIRISRQLKYFFSAFFCISYFLLNISTAKALDNELRSNDLEWALLLKEQKFIRENYLVTERILSAKQDMLNLYYRNASSKPLKRIIYMPSDYITHTKKRNWEVRYAVPFRTIKFKHAFHTTFQNETHEKIIIQPGFYLPK